MLEQVPHPAHLNKSSHVQLLHAALCALHQLPVGLHTVTTATDQHLGLTYFLFLLRSDLLGHYLQVNKMEIYPLKTIYFYQTTWNKFCLLMIIGYIYP